jgi:3-oxoacyl-[acyl-carrier protein] reductase
LISNQGYATGARSTTESLRQQLANIFPLGRIGEPADVAGAALFLISDSSSWITGITLDVAGGRVMV